MSLFRRSRALSAFLGGALLLGAGTAFAEFGLNMTEGVTEVSREVYGLHMLIFYVCCAIAVVVFGAMFYSIFAHRKSVGAVPAQFHESTTVEIIWTVVPFVILIAMAIPATQSLIKLEDASNPEMTIKITGYQWKWGYEYPEQNISFISNLDKTSNAARLLNSGTDVSGVQDYLLSVDKPLVIPTGKKIRFLITSSDVIHSWWVPDFGWKKDAIPGFINEAWTKVDEPGVFRGQCAELCGKDHGFMPIVVRALSPEDFDKWVAEQGGTTAAAADAAAPTVMAAAEGMADKTMPMAKETMTDAMPADTSMSKDDLMARGKDVYATSCGSCHGATGAGLQGLFPAITGSAFATGDIAAHMDIVMNGRPGTAMAAYKHQLNDTDIAAVVTFERNALGNSAGDHLEPSAVKAAR